MIVLAVNVLLVLLIVSFITVKPPQYVLNDLYQFALGEKDKISKNDSQWEVYLNQKDAKIDSLSRVIDHYRANQLPEKAKVKTTSTGLNLRSLPSTDSDVISKIPDGAEVQLFYKDDEVINIGGQSGSWVKIAYEGKKGFVFSTYLIY